MKLYEVYGGDTIKAIEEIRISWWTIFSASGLKGG